MQLAVDVLSVIDAGDGVVVVAGELDAATAGQLTRRLSAPPPLRVIDLSGVTFIDASGLRVLVDACDRAAEPVSSARTLPAGCSALRDHRTDRDAC